MKRIFHAFLFLLIIMPLLTKGSPQTQESLSQPVQAEQEALTAPGPTDSAELEAFLEGILTAYMESNHIAGATLAVVKDGEVFFVKG